MLFDQHAAAVGLTIEELFGYSANDFSPEARKIRASLMCPFIQKKCTKLFRDGVPTGACTVKQTSFPVPTICCPNRLYAQDNLILKELATDVFGSGVQLFSGADAKTAAGEGNAVAVFGKRWGKELRLPGRKGKGRYFVDWVLAKLDRTGQVEEFVAVEVQTIDTTGTYRPARDMLMKGKVPVSASEAGLNWENVSKRILPQLIFKGHVLQREPLCKKGLYFICPTSVYERIINRLGGRPDAYHLQPGAVTFRCYDLQPLSALGTIRGLLKGNQFTTAVQQVALAFTSPTNLPESGSYLQAIQASLGLA